MTPRSQHLAGQVAAASFDRLARGHPSWVAVRGFFPHVQRPLFHATTGARAACIWSEGIDLAAGADVAGKPAQSGVSLTRNLGFALRWQPYVLVFDEAELAARFRVSPVSYGGSTWEDEFEERAWTQRIPPRFIRGMIVGGSPPPRFILREWASLPFPVVYSGAGNEWHSASERHSPKEG